jgi:2-polyprenyl-3-methyl-5-hydroxy-6-metoxy-1,4-benzoquinol methylase
MESAIALNEERAPMFDAILRILRRYAKTGSMLVDVGCSYGGFLERAQSHGYEVRGIDIVPESVEYVRSRGIPCEVAASLEEARIPENSADIVSVLDCNYYWPVQGKELGLIHSELKRDGLLAIRTVDTSIALQLGLWLRKWLPDAGRRLSEYAVYDYRVVIPTRALLQIVRQQGFEILEASPRAAIPLRHNSWMIRFAYAVGQLTWVVAHYNLAPGFVLLARKKTR